MLATTAVPFARLNAAEMLLFCVRSVLAALLAAAKAALAVSKAALATV